MRRTAVALICAISLVAVESAEVTRPPVQGAGDALAAALVIFDGVP